MDRFTSNDSTANAVESDSMFSQIAADTWRVPAVVKDSEKSAALALGALVGSASLVIATRGKASKALAQIGESSSTVVTMGTRQLLPAEVRSAGYATSISHDVRQSVKIGSASDAGAIGSRSSAAGEVKVAAPIGKTPPIQAAEFKLPYPVSNADEAILKRAGEKGRLQEATGEMVRHPETGQPLSSAERFYANYVDEMPRMHKPEYLESGHLVPAIYEMNFAQFAREFGNGTRRQNLLANFEDALQGLRQGNVKTVHVGGSFVTRKHQPHDIDFMWDKLAGKVDFEFLSKHRYGSLLHHDSQLLKQNGLQMMITPPADGTYKGVLHFFAHHSVPYQAMKRGAMRTLHRSHPNGIVELDLTTLPLRATRNSLDIAS